MIQHLDQTIDWYRRVTSFAQSPLNTQELLLREGVRANATQAVRLAFQFADAQAAALDAASPVSGKSADGNAPASRARIRQGATRAAAKIDQLKSQLDDVNRQLADARPDAQPSLISRRDHLNAQLQLVQAQREVLTDYAQFMTGAAGGEGLTQKVTDLESSVPEVKDQPAKAAAGSKADDADNTSTSAAAATAAATAQSTFHPESAGAFELISQMFTLSSRMTELNKLAETAGKLHDRAESMRGPIRASIVDAIHRGDAISNTTQPSDDADQLDSERAELDQLTTRFKQLAATGVPLAEQSIMLDAARQGLLNWHASLGRDFGRALRALLIRATAMVATILVLIGISELWRRATYKYVIDPRRRRTLMTVRRIVLAAVVLVIIIGSVVSEFGSLATFAGLITAGIAVALQTVILSGVAYFFFIGRFGVRVGDRVTINGITGDVIEIGLFRIYLMELGGPKIGPHATGRIVVFSNAVLFQPQAFYKQLPGADYVWHEISFTLAPDTDYHTAEDRLLGAVESVYNEYKSEVENQYRETTGSMQVAMEAPKPTGRLRFVESGLEFAVRFPVPLRRASEIDDKITRHLLDAVNREPRLKMVPTATPKIQAA